METGTGGMKIRTLFKVLVRNRETLVSFPFPTQPGCLRGFTVNNDVNKAVRRLNITMTKNYTLNSIIKIEKREVCV